MPPHRGVLGGFAALTQATFMDILKNVGPHVGSPKVGRHLMKGLLGP